MTSSKSDKINRKFIRRMVRSSFEVADFFIDEPIFLRNMRIFKKKSAKYRGKSALPNLMCSTLLRLTLFSKARAPRLGFPGKHFRFCFAFFLRNYSFFSRIGELLKTKSAPTEVSAPKNTNPNCCYTKTNNMDKSPQQSAEFAFLPNSLDCC